MSANPDTGIDAAVDRFAIKSVSGGNFINLNAVWPRVDGAALSGANPDLAYYKRVATSRPDIDHRHTTAEVWAPFDFTPAVSPSSGLPVGEFRQSFTITKLDAADLKLQVDTEFQRQVRIQFPDVENPAKVVEAAGVLASKQAGAVLTTEQQALLDSFVGLQNKIRQMRDRVTELYTAIDEDEDYEITEGWTS
jgi:hypothetical protein